MDNLIALAPNQWVNKYADQLFSYTIVRINDTGAAEDIVQETFLSAWKARDSYQGHASEKNWLYAICKNKIIDYYRRQSSGMAIVVSGEENEYFDDLDHWTQETRPKEWAIDYSQPVETKEFYSVLEKCRQKLKDIQQTVFVMKYMDDLESEEICKALDLTPSNYWVIIHRAKLNLRKCLEKNWVNL
jgi:RNA polymerase sigma-70 factor (TIGR02943 family)